MVNTRWKRDGEEIVICRWDYGCASGAYRTVGVPVWFEVEINYATLKQEWTRILP
ncbi:hypothetical protein NVP1208B_30 [Vibrio phage 1.208.B._10N.222.52.A7]|nr:hypothetical protein NVP1208B_30 [Vibrio phage 1.208.B._10N.222.52.A7]